MDRLFFAIGAISAFLSVGAGAFGSHSWRSQMTADLLNVFETGARYQMYHAFGLIAVAWAVARWPGSTASLAGWLFIVGTVFFSGSLYLLSLTGRTWLGAITPLGGVAFLAGWLLLAWAAWRG